jgi:hypothetical protein
MRWVKANKQETPSVDASNKSFMAKATIVADITERTVRKVAVAVLLYVAMDTVRQVAVERASQS